jgi:hypothetical protein
MSMDGLEGSSGTTDANGTPARRLMHFKLFSQIANRFYGDIKVALGIPYSIAALEEFIGIGSSDGAIRLYDTSDESEIKVLTEKNLKQNAVLCIDMKRYRNDNIFVVAGYAKG